MKNEQTMSVFDLCRKKVKMSLRETLSWLSLPDSLLDYESIEINDRYYLMIAGDVAKVSCDKKEFDRWCNSTEQTFDLSKRSERRLFIDLIESVII